MTIAGASGTLKCVLSARACVFLSVKEETRKFSRFNSSLMVQRLFGNIHHCGLMVFLTCAGTMHSNICPHICLHRKSVRPQLIHIVIARCSAYLHGMIRYANFVSVRQTFFILCLRRTYEPFLYYTSSYQQQLLHRMYPSHVGQSRQSHTIHAAYWHRPRAHCPYDYKIWY